jgi:ketosteroid isomerase-like protein
MVPSLLPMIRIMRILALTFCALAAAAAAQPIANMPQQRTRIVPAGTDPRLLAAITKPNSEFEVAMKKADISMIAEPYTEDAVFVTTDGTALKGRAQIEQLYRQRFAKSGPALEAKIESDELMLDGDLAYERGRGLLARMGRSGVFWKQTPSGFCRSSLLT